MVNFGEYIRTSRIPRWREFYVSYNLLKAYLKEAAVSGDNAKFITLLGSDLAKVDKK
jgi:SPX domain protein involved in polyphosphate accumulation